MQTWSITKILDLGGQQDYCSHMGLTTTQQMVTWISMKYTKFCCTNSLSVPSGVTLELADHFLSLQGFLQTVTIDLRLIAWIRAWLGKGVYIFLLLHCFSSENPHFLLIWITHFIQWGNQQSWRKAEWGGRFLLRDFTFNSFLQAACHQSSC